MVAAEPAKTGIAKAGANDADGGVQHSVSNGIWRPERLIDIGGYRGVYKMPQSRDDEKNIKFHFVRKQRPTSIDAHAFNVGRRGGHVVAAWFPIPVRFVPQPFGRSLARKKQIIGRWWHQYKYRLIPIHLLCRCNNSGIKGVLQHPCPNVNDSSAEKTAVNRKQLLPANFQQRGVCNVRGENLQRTS